MLSVGQFLSRHTASLILSLSTVSIAAIAANPGIFLGGFIVRWNLRNEYYVAEK